MQFTSGQQTYIDNLIKAKYGEAYAKAEQKYQDALEQAAEAKLEPLKARLTEAHDKLRVMEIRSAASAHGAINAEQVAQLLDSFIRADDSGSLFVFDGDGERRYNRDGSPLSVQTAVKDFLDDNPHMVKSQPAGGSGTSNQNFLGLV